MCFKHLSLKSYQSVSLHKLEMDLNLHESVLMPLLPELKAAKKLKVDIDFYTSVLTPI